MMDGTSRGPVVPDSDHLLRVITTASWWKTATDQPSSAAFNYPAFSADIGSKTTATKTLTRFRAGSGLVSFQSAKAKEIGFDPREEIDPQFPENLAHATVYNDAGTSQRKRMARRLADACETMVRPSFGAAT